MSDRDLNHGSSPFSLRAILEWGVVVALAAVAWHSGMLWRLHVVLQSYGLTLVALLGLVVGFVVGKVVGGVPRARETLFVASALVLAAILSSGTTNLWEGCVVFYVCTGTLCGSLVTHPPGHPVDIESPRPSGRELPSKLAERQGAVAPDQARPDRGSLPGPSARLPASVVLCTVYIFISAAMLAALLIFLMFGVGMPETVAHELQRLPGLLGAALVLCLPPIVLQTIAVTSRSVWPARLVSDMFWIAFWLCSFFYLIVLIVFLTVVGASDGSPDLPPATVALLILMLLPTRISLYVARTMDGWSYELETTRGGPG